MKASVKLSVNSLSPAMVRWTGPGIPKAWRVAQILAARLMARELGPIGNIKGATNFHAARVHPSWASGFEKIAKIGNHVFYRC